VTLTSAINAAREALQFETIRGGKSKYAQGRRDLAIEILAALPDKPMTEVQLFDLIDDATKIKLEGETIHEIIDALKSANVLFVGKD
jgi:hypothetical protein